MTLNKRGIQEKPSDDEENTKKINTGAACALAGIPGNKPVFPQWA
jgi:hypothetical protein